MEYSKEKDFKLGKVIILSITHFIHDIYTAFLSPLLPVIIQRLKLSLFKAGLMLPIFRIPILIQPYIGYHADRGKASRFLPLALIVTSVSMSLFANVNTYLTACILLFITGTSAAFYHAPAVFLVGNVSGTRSGSGMSIFMTGGEMARSLGPLYIVTLINLVQLKFTILASIPGLIAALILMFIIPELAKKEYNKEKHSLTFNKLFKEGGKGLYLLIFISIFQSFTKFSFTLFLPTYMKTMGFKLFVAGSSLSILEVTGAIGALIGGTVSDFIGRKKFLIISTLAIPLFINLFLSSETLLLKMSFLLVEGVFMFSISPVRYALAQELVPKYKGTVSSLIMALSFFTTTFASVITGYLGDKYGLYSAFKIISFVPIVTVPLIIFLPNKKIN